MRDSSGRMAGVTRGQVLRYMLLPEIFPRLRAFSNAGFGNLAYFLALVYRAVNILPQSHPFFKRGEIRTFTIRDVIVQAASHITFDRHNIDKVIIFFAIVTGLVMLVLQFAVLLVMMFVNPAAAASQPKNYGDFFFDSNRETDLAYRMLFLVFGVPELFGKSGATVQNFHTALHAMFQLYSIGLLVIGVLITCYFIVAVVMETAQTGVPFGKRFNHVWAPIRFVVGIGLLIPVGYGLNSAQWITLYSAKLGSDFATKGWVLFNNKMTDTYLGEKESLIATPQAPELQYLAAFIMIARTCEYAYADLYDKTIVAYLVKNSAEDGTAVQLVMKDFKQARKYFNQGGDIHIRFGEFDKDKFAKFKGYVYPYCGDLVIPMTDLKDPGTESIQQFYYQLIQQLWGDADFNIPKYALQYQKTYIQKNGTTPPSAQSPPPEYKKKVAEKFKALVEPAIRNAIAAQKNSPQWALEKKKIKELGWGGAGIWYNKIAQLNGSLIL